MLLPAVSFRSSVTETEFFSRASAAKPAWFEERRSQITLLACFPCACVSLLLCFRCALFFTATHDRFRDVIRAWLKTKETVISVRDDSQTSRCFFPIRESGRRNELKSVFVVHETEDGDAGVQDDGLPVLSVPMPGWRRTTHSAMMCVRMRTRSKVKFIGAETPRGVDSLNVEARES